ncbi:MAG TPA: FAD-dependent oxidoreductase [bacterium]
MAKLTRREFLIGAAGTAGYLGLNGLLPRIAFASPDLGTPAGAWGGAEPGYCHDTVRDGGTVPPPSSGRSAQVCIVGGGLSGLAAAYRLRDTDLVLLEHLKSTGGHAARGRWKDVWYSECAAYFVEPEPPLDAFYEELKFPFKKIEEPSDSALIDGKYVLDTFGGGAGKLPFPDAARKDFARMRKEMEKLLESDDYPNMPIGDGTAEARKLDRMTWADWLLKERGFHPAVKIFVDLYSRSALGAPSSEYLSAYAGLNFWASEFMPRYTFPGGNALAAEMLHDAVEKAGRGRIVKPATAVFVEPRERDVAVTYLDAEGKAHLVEAKTVIMACPKFLARHIVKGIPKDQEAAIRELTYGTYVVANALCSEPIVEASYDTWTNAAPFTDFIVADWVSRTGASKRAPTKQQVLSVYWPTAYDHESPLKDGSFASFKEGTIAGLEKLLPGARKKIVDVRLTRWGHALCHGKPGWYTEKSEIVKRSMGRLHFAHSDNQGLPAFESALVEGLEAATRAKETLAKG